MSIKDGFNFGIGFILATLVFPVLVILTMAAITLGLTLAMGSF